MTRETKVGLVVAGSFICLVAIVVAAKFRAADGPAEVADAGGKNAVQSDKDRPKKKDQKKAGQDRTSAVPGVTQASHQEPKPGSANPAGQPVSTGSDRSSVGDNGEVRLPAPPADADGKVTAQLGENMALTRGTTNDQTPPVPPEPRALRVGATDSGPLPPVPPPIGPPQTVPPGTEPARPPAPMMPTPPPTFAAVPPAPATMTTPPDPPAGPPPAVPPAPAPAPAPAPPAPFPPAPPTASGIGELAVPPGPAPAPPPPAPAGNGGSGTWAPPGPAAPAPIGGLPVPPPPTPPGGPPAATGGAPDVPLPSPLTTPPTAPPTSSLTTPPAAAPTATAGVSGVAPPTSPLTTPLTVPPAATAGAPAVAPPPNPLATPPTAPPAPTGGPPVVPPPGPLATPPAPPAPIGAAPAVPPPAPPNVGPAPTPPPAPPLPPSLGGLSGSGATPAPAPLGATQTGVAVASMTAAPAGSSTAAPTPQPIGALPGPALDSTPPLGQLVPRPGQETRPSTQFAAPLAPPAPSGANQNTRPAPVIGADSPPPPPPLAPNSRPATVAPIGPGLVEPSAPARTATGSGANSAPIQPIGAVPAPLGANVGQPAAVPLGELATQVKVTGITYYTCESDVTSFTDVSRKVYNDEKYGLALKLFNDTFPDKPLPLPGHKVHVPHISFLEQNYGSAIGGRPAPLGMLIPAAGDPNLSATTSARPGNVATGGNPSGGDRPSTADFTPVVGGKPAAIPIDNPARRVGSPVGQIEPKSPPQSPATLPANTDGTRSYRVASQGESILDIARRTLGDSRRWPEIYRLNGGVDPRYPIPGGTNLRLPSSADIAATQ